MKEITLFEYKFANLTYEEVFQAIEVLLNKPAFHYFVTLNPEILLSAKKDEHLDQIIRAADFVFADGIGIVLGAYLMSRQKIKKVTGSDLTIKLFEKNKYSFYLIGSKPEIIKRANEQLQEMYPGSKVLGVRDGYFNQSQEAVIIKEIKNLKPDFILVGLGSPKQDYFLSELNRVLTYGIGIGIGGVFDVLSGEKKRSPEFLQKIGLEWVYRGLIEPKRMKRWVFIPKYFWFLIKSFFVAYRQ
ncbi:MAG: WecB/TagA/CpsF family glycosyltransferase [Candidatus Margulisiibacteriota bacterium]|jgi:N-acetylglucosaminyldiphosphoundecaprenol N-acetyl-beta-D-mannosaminyltransferase